MESHYCRASTSREYLHADLTLRKMYEMFLEESLEHETSSSTYRRVFKTKNLSFHCPKKDVCSLCITYREGNETKKAELERKYQKHIAKKIQVRQIKEKCKNEVLENKTVLCGTFDLQQVIYLPISSESAILTLKWMN